MVVWIIGLSGAGKTTLAEETVRLMRKAGKKVALLDGDAVREVFGNDLGHSLADRRRNAERLCRLGAFLEGQGINVVCAILSVFRESRAWNREHLERYHEVFIDTPMSDLMNRDPKGLYRKALAGEIRDFPGVDLEFPVPDSPDLVIRNAGSVQALLDHAPALASLVDQA
ncbi:adenylyl-sulfate kinase [Pseudodesulfovibrio tunisiensis]|uniref:adenylyl-sulfate kinase n=1 Tax=Pseudodesulfovibrio tunisiensis TaxID=463192 RepID=UPI001FB3F22D|nr:adenylyl-sulfate kinase [Pseudodesulfovibrio tunisiensis]